MNYATTEEAAENKLTGDITYVPNGDNTYMLCTTKTLKDQVKLIEFVVVEISTNEIIYTPKERIRNVSWNSNEELKIEYMPGVAESGNTDYSYMFNVVTQKKVNKSSNNKP